MGTFHSSDQMTEALKLYLETHGFEQVKASQGRRGTNISARCPFAGTAHASGTDAHPSWGILVSTGQWYCFACKREGNLYTLASTLGIPLFDIGRGLVLSLEESFARLHAELGEEQIEQQPVLNLPDTFGFFNFQTDLELRPLKWLMAEKRFGSETLKFFGIGYDRVTKGPIFPITDDHGGIVGWQKRNLGNKGPKYEFSSGFQKKEVLYNYHAARSASTCVVVEAIMSVMALHEVGVAAVSPLNADMSKAQAAKLGTFKRVILCYDPDIAGQVALNKVGLGQWKGKRYTPPLLKGAPFELFYVTPPTKLHRMNREQLIPLFEQRKRA